MPTVYHLVILKGNEIYPNIIFLSALYFYFDLDLNLNGWSDSV